MIIENQQNIKCHFATTEDIGHAISSIAGKRTIRFRFCISFRMENFQWWKDVPTKNN